MKSWKKNCTGLNFQCIISMILSYCSYPKAVEEHPSLLQQLLKYPNDEPYSILFISMISYFEAYLLPIPKISFRHPSLLLHPLKYPNDELYAYSSSYTGFQMTARIFSCGLMECQLVFL